MTRPDSKITLSVYQIPSPEERSLILEKIVRDHKKITDTEFLTLTKFELASIRTELTGIAGYLGMLLVGDFGPVSAEQKKVLGDLVKSCGQRLASIEHLLELTKIQSEKRKN